MGREGWELLKDMHVLVAIFNMTKIGTRRYN